MSHIIAHLSLHMRKGVLSAGTHCSYYDDDAYQAELAWVGSHLQVCQRFFGLRSEASMYVNALISISLSDCLFSANFRSQVLVQTESCQAFGTM